MFSKAVALALAGAVAVQAANSTLVTITKVVDVYTTYCPHPTHLTMNNKTYTVTEPCTFTITDCPCTVIKAVPTGYGHDGKYDHDGHDGHDGKYGHDGHDGKYGHDGHDGKYGHDGHDGKYDHDGHDGHDGKYDHDGHDGHDGKYDHDGHDGKYDHDGHDSHDGHDGNYGHDGNNGYNGNNAGSANNAGNKGPNPSTAVATGGAGYQCSGGKDCPPPVVGAAGQNTAAYGMALAGVIAAAAVAL